MKLEDILKDILAKTGIRRENTPSLNNPDGAVKVFSKIADAMLQWKGQTFDTEAVRPEIEMLIGWTYLLDDSLDYTKGILLKGNTGTGKTFIFRVWKEFLRIDRPKFVSNGLVFPMNPEIVNVRTIASEFASDDLDAIRRYSRIPMLVLDDIGAEPDIQNAYGNRTNIIADIIDRRNEASLLTFGTTNLNKMTGEDGYDDRTARRMRELFNVRAMRKGYNGYNTNGK